MFSLKNFIKRGFIQAVGKMAEYQIILNAAGWLEKGVLDEADLLEIQTAIDEQHLAAEKENQATEELKELIEETETQEEV